MIDNELNSKIDTEVGSVIEDLFENLEYSELAYEVLAVFVNKLTERVIEQESIDEDVETQEIEDIEVQ